MADVRLTAINPEDSSVVPVACNDKGELKLESPPPFDGNVDGDLTVSGNATFGGVIQAGNVVSGSYGVIAINNADSGSDKASIVCGNQDTTGRVFLGQGNGFTTSEIFANGSATFAGNVVSGSLTDSYAALFPEGQCWLSTNSAATSASLAVGIKSGNQTFGVYKEGTAFIGPNIQLSGQGVPIDANIELNVDGSATFAGNVRVGDSTTAGNYVRVERSDAGNVWSGNGSSGNTSSITDTGSATFAGGKCGFTSEGRLWVTDNKNETWATLRCTSGIMNWELYTPPTRMEQIKEKVQIDPNFGVTPDIDPNFGVQPETDTGTP